MKQILVSCFLLFSGISLNAQDCAPWWAPCPHSDEISIARNAPQREDKNTVLPQEMAMEDKLRSALTDIIQKLAAQKHWQFYELNESGYDRMDGSISYPKWNVTPYEKRPPHVYCIAFILVVNSDSLHAWRDWYLNDYSKEEKQAITGGSLVMQSEDNNQALQGYMDSAKYYLLKRTDYAINNASQHSNDMRTNNKQGIKNYQDKLAWYKKKSDGFLNDYKSASDAKNAPAIHSSDALHNDYLSKTRLFTNASLVLIDFSVNNLQTGIASAGKNQKGILLHIPNAFYARMLQNMAKPIDNEYGIQRFAFGYNRPLFSAAILFGGWRPGVDGYNNSNMQASYMDKSAAHDIASIKKIQCDVVQNMGMEIQGRQGYVQQTLKAIDFPALENMVAQKF